MRISDWSSDVCSSDLQPAAVLVEAESGAGRGALEAGQGGARLVERATEALGVGVDEAGHLRSGDRTAQHEDQEHQVAQCPHGGQPPSRLVPYRPGGKPRCSARVAPTSAKASWPKSTEGSRVGDECVMT